MVHKQKQINPLMVAASRAVLGFCLFSHTCLHGHQLSPTPSLQFDSTTPVTTQSLRRAKVLPAQSADSFPFELKVAEKGGELIYTFNELTKNLESVTAKKDVRFTTSGTVISADDLMYKPAASEVTSTGNLKVEIANLSTLPLGAVNVEKTVITAESLIYQMAEKRMVFKGDVLIRQQDTDGKMTETRGNRIILTFDADNRMRMTVPSGTLK